VFGKKKTHRVRIVGLHPRLGIFMIRHGVFSGVFSHWDEFTTDVDTVAITVAMTALKQKLCGNLVTADPLVTKIGRYDETALRTPHTAVDFRSRHFVSHIMWLTLPVPEMYILYVKPTNCDLLCDQQTGEWKILRDGEGAGRYVQRLPLVESARREFQRQLQERAAEAV
jgi:hypothetical protein